MSAQVERAVEIPAPPAEVWEAMVDPGRLGSWLGGLIAFSPKPGEEIRFEEGSDVRCGALTQVVSGEVLEFWWATPGETEGSLVRISLEETETGTLVLVTELPMMVADIDIEPEQTSPVGFRPQALAKVG